MEYKKVVITDYYYPDLEEEKKVFNDTNIRIVDCNGRCNTEENVIAYAKDADAIITQFVPITKKIINNLEQCKIIVRYAIGLDIIDVKEATKKKIMVANVPDYCIEEVANHALALMLALLRKIILMDKETRKGIWSYKKSIPINRLSKLNLGVVAFGRIARNFVDKARVFGFKKIFIYDPYFRDFDHYPKYNFVTLRDLLENSDVVSVHAPATNETKEILNKKTFSLMRQGSYLINTSRGSLINEEDLIEEIKNGKFGGVALDVLNMENISRDHPLFQFDNVILTPHMSWYSNESIKELQQKAAEQVKKALFNIKPDYLVNDVLT